MYLELLGAVRSLLSQWTNYRQQCTMKSVLPDPSSARFRFLISLILPPCPFPTQSLREWCLYFGELFGVNGCISERVGSGAVVFSQIVVQSCVLSGFNCIILLLRLSNLVRSLMQVAGGAERGLQLINCPGSVLFITYSSPKWYTCGQRINPC